MRNEPNRRRVLTGIGAPGATAVAGCLGDDDADDVPGGDDIDDTAAGATDDDDFEPTEDDADDADDADKTDDTADADDMPDDDNGTDDPEQPLHSDMGFPACRSTRTSRSSPITSWNY